MSNNLPRDCCPICGHQFDQHYLDSLEPDQPFICPNHDIWKNDPITKESLITEDDDYAWVE